jgi:hypothetical protein
MYCTEMCVYIIYIYIVCSGHVCQRVRVLVRVCVCVCVRMIVHMCIWFICVVVSYSPMNVHTDSIASYDSYVNTQQGGLLLPLSRPYWNHTEPFVSENKMRPKRGSTTLANTNSKQSGQADHWNSETSGQAFGPKFVTCWLRVISLRRKNQQRRAWFSRLGFSQDDFFFDRWWFWKLHIMSFPCSSTTSEPVAPS